MDGAASSGLRIAVGTHYRVWWFWLPIIFGSLSLLAAAVLLPLVPPLGFVALASAATCLLVATVAGVVIERGRRWIELSDDGFRLSDRSVQAVVADQQVTDLALHRQPHHGAGKLLAETRHLILWIETADGGQRLKLTSRMAPRAVDPLQPLINRLCRRLTEQAARDLAARGNIEGDGWALDAAHLHVATKRQRSSIPLDELSAVETIGQEVRLWQRGNPYAVARVPLSGRNGWLLERLLSRRLVNRSAADPVSGGVLDEQPLIDDDAAAGDHSRLGRVLFERAPGSGAIVIFGVMALLLALVGGVSLWIAIPARDPLLSSAGGLLLLLSSLCLAGGLRVRRIRFRCHERGLERITMTARKRLAFDDIDVFSFESRRNQSQGRYTGTTYTLIFADRTREQGRGIFYSTTVRNHDEDLDDLRDRVSQIIARRMAQTFAAHQSVQWTPEIWFRSDALEYIRRRRWFVSSKVAVVPYDTVTDFELRDGLFYIWTSYQQRAVIAVNAGAPNFYPGLILLEGLARTQRRQPAPASVPSIP